MCVSEAIPPLDPLPNQEGNYGVIAKPDSEAEGSFFGGQWGRPSGETNG